MRLSEIYTSIQGEGPRVGLPTVFTRFGGCNLRCKGWPCDTQHAIDPKYRDEWRKLSPQETFDEVVSVAQLTGTKNICFTGGEPFLQPKYELQELTNLLLNDKYHVECFSNGTLLYPGWAWETIQFVMDWKLDGSGEDPRNATRLTNLHHLEESELPQSIKFVIKNSHDYLQAVELWTRYVKSLKNITVYFGEVWGSELTLPNLINLVLRDKLPWRLNVQVHNFIWDRNQRGI